ncbi:hypothetical protein V1522DRAFT_416477 [Lipomyces starkeyi]
MDHTKLIDIVRRPLSPDTQVEVAASREEYDQVLEILEDEGARYPQLLYDSARTVAIVVAAPSPLHGRMAYELVTNIRDEVMRSHGIDAAVKSRVSGENDTTNTRSTAHGRTTRAWDSALFYSEDDGDTLMIAVEVGVSQRYESLRRAISWCVAALHCRLGIAMCIHEEKRGQPLPVLYYNSTDDSETAIADAKEEFLHQLVGSPYGPLVWNGTTWMGTVSRVQLETYRPPQEENYSPDALLHPTRSFTVIREGQFVGGDVPPNLHELVLGDCIPSHILSDGVVEARPLNFFQRDWFELKFRGALLRTALGRLDRQPQVVAPNSESGPPF